MTEDFGRVGGSAPTTVYCPQCGRPMRVAAEHVETIVECPHCRHALEPRHLAGRTPPGTPSAARLGYDDPRQGFAGYSWRNRWVAGALGILLGPFGVHRFYLGFTGIGVLQAVLTIGSVFILTPVVAIWAFIEGILCFCGAMHDVDGLPLRS